MAKEFAYCSSGCTRPQFERQINNINKKYPNAIIVKEVYSQTRTDRTELKKLLVQLEKDDTLIVNSIDRLSRDPEDFLSYYKEFSQRGVNLIFINQPFMNSEIFTSACRMMADQATEPELQVFTDGMYGLLKSQISILLDQSWQDLQDHRDQMKASYKKAKEREKESGRPVGKRYESRKSFMVKELIRRYNQQFDGSMNDIQTMEQIRNEMGTISRNTYYKYKKELVEDET